MKRIAVLAVITVGGLAAALASSGVIAQGAGRAGGGGGGLPGITGIQQIHGNVYKIFGNGGNTTVFVRDKDVVLVDTKLPNSGQQILDEVRKITDKPVSMVINTHSHIDHVGSNPFFTDANDRVQVVAQTNSAARMREGGGPLPALKVDKTFDDQLTLDSDKDEIDLYYFGPGHTDGDTFVVFPAERTMAAGDIYAWHMSPLIDPTAGGSMIAAPTSLTRAEYTIRNVDTVITGHGDAHSWDEFKSYVKFTRALVQTAESTLARGGSEQDALADLERAPSHMIFLGDKLLPGLEYGGTPKSRALIDLMVAFQELRGEKPQLIMNLPAAQGGPPAPAAGAPQGQAPGRGQARPPQGQAPAQPPRN